MLTLSVEMKLLHGLESRDDLFSFCISGRMQVFYYLSLCSPWVISASVLLLCIEGYG